MKILLLEDDLRLSGLIVRGLRREGHAVDSAGTVEDARWSTAESTYDVLILDVMLPDGDGFGLCAELRASGDWTPVLMLTARDAVADRVRGLDVGADDYLVKPFAGSELLARVAALGRRQPIADAVTLLSVGDLEVDLLKRTVTRAGRRIDLQQQEYKLLEYLMRHAGEIVTRTMLLENVWSFHFDPGTNLIESHMSRLRAKVDRGFDRDLIHTVRNAGYRLDAET